MNRKIEHRGPDQDGVFLDNAVSLGHRRLSIIDLSPNARQPMFNEDRSLLIVFNGEIYNFQELKKDLEKRGHKFCSQSDTEVILHLYEDKGEDCLKFLNGIFAFAIWDIRKKELFLARDRIGVKPLYYYFKDGKFIFSSEIKAILEHDIKREVDLEALNHYFRSLYVPAPLTMFKNIFKLPQAHYLKLRAGKIQLKRYWDIGDFSDSESKEEIIEKIQALMRKSVKGQLISDRPVGIFLSGGIDSTSVLGVSREFLSGKIKTFSVGFDIDDPNNKFNADFLLARETSKFYNTEHHELLVKSKDILDNIEKVIYHLDEPIAEPTQAATFLLSKLAKKEVAVVLGGDGGDELFGGYKRYYYSYLLNRFKATAMFPFLKSKIYARFMLQKEEEINKILSDEINKPRLTEKFFEDNYLENNLVKDFEKLFMLTDLKTWLVDESLMRTDKMTMAFGLEQRVPILDHYLVELAAKTPSKFKIKNKAEGKAIFKEAMDKYLPPQIKESAQKKVWLTPMSQWLREDLNRFASDVISSEYSSVVKNYFNFEGIKKMFDEHIDKTKYNLNLIWAIITFQVWSRNYL